MSYDTQKHEDDGYEDYFRGVAKQDNPYCEKAEEAEHDAWIRGWERADSDSDDE